MPRKREPAPQDFEAIAMARPNCRLTEETRTWLREKFPDSELSEFFVVIEDLLSTYLRWTVQVEGRPSREARTVDLEDFVADVDLRLGVFESLQSLRGQLDERLGGTKAFLPPEDTLSGTEFILSLSRRLIELRSALSSGITRQPPIIGQQILDLAGAVERISGLESGIVLEASKLLIRSPPSKSGPMEKLNQDLALAQEAAEVLLARNQAKRGAEARTSLSQFVRWMMGPYEKYTGESFSHTTYADSDSAVNTGVPQTTAGKILCKILDPSSVTVEYPDPGSNSQKAKTEQDGGPDSPPGSKPPSYRWPSESEIATAMRRTIAMEKRKHRKSKES